MHLLIVVGGITALVGTVVMLTQTNIKSNLAWSTISQMGFMLLQCGFGAFAAATLHIVAHSLYKAHAFLASGSAVDVAQSSPRSISAPRLQMITLLGAVGGAALLFIAVGLLWGVTPAEKPGIVALGAILVMGLSQLLLRGLSGPQGGQLTSRLLLTVAGLAFLYFGLQQGASWLMAGHVPEPTAPDTSTTALATIFVVLFGGVSLIQFYGLMWTVRWPSVYVHATNGFYANALFDRIIGSLRVSSLEQK